MTGYFTATESDACDKCSALIRKGERIYVEELGASIERIVCVVCAP